jgi:hypothetical protein
VQFGRSTTWQAGFRRDLLRRFHCRAGRQRFALGPLDQLAKCFVPHPESGTSAAFQDRNLLRSQPAADEAVPIAARRAKQPGGSAGIKLRDQASPAVMAKTSLIADQSQAVRTNRGEIAFMQREFSLTIRAALGIVRACRPACGAAHNLSLVSRRLLYDEDMAAVTPKPTSNRPVAGIILPLAFRAGNEEAHGGIINHGYLATRPERQLPLPYTISPTLSSFPSGVSP